MKRKLIGVLSLAILLGFVGYMTVYPRVIHTTAPAALTGIATQAGLWPAHEIRPPFPYVYYYIGMAFVDTGGVNSGWNWNYHGYPVWVMDYQDTASSIPFAFPAGADRAYISALPLADHASDSINMKFGFESRNTFADFGSDPDGVGWGTLQKGWYQVGTVQLISEDTGDSLKKAILSFPTKAIGNQWKLSCETQPATKKHKQIYDSSCVVAAQVTFGFPGEKQYYVQYYPDPAQGDEVGGKLFQSKGRTGADTTQTCRAPAFTTFTLFARPTSLGDSLKAYVVLEAKRLRGLSGPEAGWNKVDSIYLNTAADSVGEVVIIDGRTKAFFDEYRLRTNPLKRASGNDSTSTLKLEIFGVFNP